MSFDSFEQMIRKAFADMDRKNEDLRRRLAGAGNEDDHFQTANDADKGEN